MPENASTPKDECQNMMVTELNVNKLSVNKVALAHSVHFQFIELFIFVK